MTTAYNGGSQLTSIVLYWDQGTGTWVELIGESSDSLVTTFTVTGLTQGSNYSFKYAGKNAFGLGTFSSSVTIKAASAPAQVTTISTQNSGTDVLLTWDAPSDNGADITAYLIEVETSVDGTYVEDTSSCDGSQTSVVTGRSCTFSLATLTGVTYSLTQGNLVQIRIKATNSIGTGVDSADLTSGALILAKPTDPSSGVTKVDASTNTGQVTFTIPEATGSEDGGSAITSYIVYWDEGDGATPDTELVGETSDNLDLTLTVSTGISSGQDYIFMYKLKNAIGESDWSPTTTILAATVPAKPSAPTVSYPSASTYRVTFTDPSDTGGSGVAISDYTIELKAKSGAFSEYLTTCDGSSSSVKTNKYCEVAIGVLTGSDFNLVQGDTVVARVKVANTLGESEYSDESSDAILIFAVPQAPTTAPLRGSASTASNIVIDLT